MSQHATGAFTIDIWNAQPYDERDGVTLTRAHVTKTFHGEIEGTSTAELLLVGTAVEGSAAYVGIERVTAAVNGHAGSFILKHNAVSAHGAQVGEWTIVPDSGSGALRGISGTARIEIGPDGSHTLALDYDDLPND